MSAPDTLAGRGAPSIYEGPTLDVARRLVGCTLWRCLDGARLSGRIVETEAYLVGDEASHAFGGPTPRNGSMFAPPGTIYVYRIHQSFCLNVVTGPEGVGEAVLIRALCPAEGLDAMRALRHRSAPRDLTTGPGKLCQALGIDLDLDGARLDGEAIGIEPGSAPSDLVRATVRIGISRNADAPYRFVACDSPFLSRPI